MTVSDTVAECLIAPEVAVIEMVYTPGLLAGLVPGPGEGVVGGGFPAFDPPPPPHEEQTSKRIAASITRPIVFFFERRGTAITTKPANGINSNVSLIPAITDSCLSEAVVAAAVEIVTVEYPPARMLAGSNLQVAFAGSPEHVSITPS